MRLEYIKPFTEAAYEIFASYIVDGSIDVSNIVLEDGFVPVSGVALTSTLSGDVVGNIVIDMPVDPALSVVELMGDGQADMSNKLTVSTLQELLNLIAGLFVTKLESSGINVNISPPTVVYGQNAKIFTISFEALHIKINTSIGGFDVLVAIESEKE